jgi:hypothetical protein
LGLVTALAAGLLGFLATLAGVGGKAAIGTGVARTARVGSGIGGVVFFCSANRAWLAMVATRWVSKSSSMRR